ncbi:MAG: hypothetical protein AAGL96_00780 [Pseudomonadota bacterium]
MDYLYWSPQYLGFRSISQRYWTDNTTHIAVPKSMVNLSGPLYSRKIGNSDFRQFLESREETFNDIFNLTFGISGQELCAEILHELCDIGTTKRLEPLGWNFGERLGAPWLSEVSQPDGYFWGEEFSIGVELKFKARTSVDQIAKYLLAFSYDAISGAKGKSFYLLYVAPDPNKLFETLGFIGNKTIDEQYGLIQKEAKKSVVSRLQELRSTPQETLTRLRILGITWLEFANSLELVADRYQGDNVGDALVRRLLSGLRHEVLRHPDNGIPR